MTPERWRELEELYHAAQGLPPAERDRLLEHADPEPRATLASILAQDDTSREGSSLLDRPAWVGRKSLLKTDAVVSAGMQLGPYRIEQRIGQGGMGEVFRATDTRLGRTVAIKTSLVQFTERFEREARTIAALIEYGPFAPMDLPIKMPGIVTQHDGERLRFTPGRPWSGFHAGTEATPWQDFWFLDLATMSTRRLTRLTDRAMMRTFDLTPDGKQIIFDRQRENSAVVLIGT